MPRPKKMNHHLRRKWEDRNTRRINPQEYRTIELDLEINRLLNGLPYSTECRRIMIPDSRTADRALEVIAEMRKAGRDNRNECGRYLCPRCKNWHLTSKPRTKTA